MANTTIKIIDTLLRGGGIRKHENEVNEYLKNSDKELVDVKLAIDDIKAYSLIIEKE